MLVNGNLARYLKNNKQSKQYIYMIKRERTRKSKIEQNPYMYYMTNWGFMETEIKEDRPVALKKENDKLEK